jgi:hypothetical protein
MESKSRLKPLTLGLTRPYLSIDLSKVGISVARLVSQSGAYFSKPLDDARYSLSTPEGLLTEEIPSSETERMFDLVDEATLRLSLHLSVRLQTPNLRMTIIPKEYVSLTIDLHNKEFQIDIATARWEQANQLAELLTEGVTLVTVKLPPEHQYIEPFLHSLLRDHPLTERNVFLVMRFKEEAPFPDIVEAVRRTCGERGLDVLRADDKEYTEDLWDNVLTYMYGCDQAVAIFDQINYREFNPNIALEVGFLRAQCKRVLLLKDIAIPILPTDIVGKIYRTFNTYAALETIPPQINKWLQDYGIGEIKDRDSVT